MKIILASSSPYRRELLERLDLQFEALAPDVDETPLDQETAGQLAQRLACLKARTIAERHAGALVIGSDQVAECRGRLLGKPGSKSRALEQLEFMRGAEVIFHTAVAVARDQQVQCEVVPTVVQMRELSTEQLLRYIERELPLDCAGAFKSERGGIALLQRLSSDDPTALVGLPLIASIRLLEQFGLEIP